MVRFSCFNSSIHSQKTKKQAYSSLEMMLKMLQVGSQNGPVNNSACFNRSTAEAKDKNDLIEHGWNSREINGNMSKLESPQNGKIRRSLSLECALLHEGSDIEENNSEDNTNQGLSVNESNDHHSPLGGSKSPRAAASYQDQETAYFESPDIGSDKVKNESIFSVGDSQYPEKGELIDNFSVQFVVECAADSSNHTPRTPCTPPMIAKSQSVPNFAYMLPSSREGSSRDAFQASRSGSSEDVSALGSMRNEISVCDVTVKNAPELNEGQNGVQDGCYSYHYAASGKDWIVPVIDDEEVHPVKKFHGESSSHHYNQLPTKDFKIKRIEDWVIDLQECAQMEETEEIVASHDQGKRPVLSVFDMRDAAKPEVRMSPGAEAAKRYISSLGANATIAQLANHGLVVIPFLSAFAGLKVVNLSGNSIVRITSGALPRGLHVLNLSKNKISTIEGLRELTRLRILDLSYNKITRIRHGLASCSSLKDLYLAGNKISEAEGLHRLLKLKVLDLRFNKISTSKCLGQLAANYNSLQAISLEGNPAQKNVGDEQLKKYLQGLLPYLAYYNRQRTSKTSFLKDSSDRSIRMGRAPHQFNRSHKSDHKSRSRMSYGSSGVKQSGHGGQAAEDSPKRGTRGKYGNFPPTTGSRSGHRRHHYHDQQVELNMKPLDLVAELAIRKSQSEGALAAL